MHSLKRIAAALAITGFLGASLHADVKLTNRTGGKGLGGMIANGDTVTYIKGMKMRTDSKVGTSDMSMIFDVGAQTITSIDHAKKEATTYTMGEFAGDLKKVTDSDIKVQFAPNGESKTILGKKCDGYTMTVTVAFAPIPDQKMDVIVTGPVFVAKGVPGHADYAAFFQAAIERGFIFSDPRVVKMQPGQAKGLAAMQKAIAEAGLPYSTEISIKFEGSGPMAGMMNKMGGSSMTSELTAVSTDPLSDDVFGVPAGYKTKTGK